MSEFAPHPPIERQTLPEFLPERVDLIKKLDVQFSEWGNNAQSRHPSIFRTPLADRIVSDLMPADLAKPHISLAQSMEERMIARHRFKRLQTLSPYAHDATLDEIPIENEAYESFFDNIFDWMGDNDRFETGKRAFTYLRRLYIVREQLALQNGLQGFDVSKLNQAFERIISDEQRLR